jgi:hypothetical protein
MGYRRYFNNVPIKNVTTHKHLGLTFSNDGSWTTHINEIITKASSRLNIIRKLKFKVDRKSLEHMYFSYVRPILEYADVVWDNCPNYIKEKLEHINYEAARFMELTETLLLIFAGSSFQSRTVEGKKLLL